MNRLRDSAHIAAARPRYYESHRGKPYGWPMPIADGVVDDHGAEAYAEPRQRERDMIPPDRPPSIHPCETLRGAPPT